MYDRQRELDRLLDLICDPPVLDQIEAIVREQCLADGRLFSGFIGVFADAMRLLGDHGIIRVTNDNGGRVVEGYVI